MTSPETLNLDMEITQAPDVFRAKLDGTLLIADQFGGQGHCMDPVGLAIWENLAIPRTLSDLCDFLCGRYEVERTRCEQDVLLFISELMEKNLVVARAPLA